MAFLIFAISLVPGMFGGRLGDLDAYVPVGHAAQAGDRGRAPAEGGLVWLKNQYREALDQARREGKLVFVNFTGYACTNCHWMKANMFTRPEIAARDEELRPGGSLRRRHRCRLRREPEAELEKFKTVAEPFYAIMDPDEKVIATFPGLTKDPQEFLAFLQKGSHSRRRAPAAAPRRPAAAIPKPSAWTVSR